MMEVGDTPQWLKPDTEFISIAQGIHYVVTEVGETITYRPYRVTDYMQTIELESFLESWTCGDIVVKGHTPMELWKGYRYSDYDLDRINNTDKTYFKWSDTPFYDFQKGNKEKYNKARKIFNM